MKLAETSTTNLVVLVLGVALVVFFAGVSAVLAVTGSAPTALWAAGAAISGALVGLLVPPPGRQTAAQLGASTTTTELGAGAVQAAQQVAEQKAGADKEAAQQAVQRVQDLTGTIQTASLMQAANLEPAKAPEAAATNAVVMLRGLETAGVPGSPQADVYGAAADAADQGRPAAQAKGADTVAAAGGTAKLPEIVWVLLGLLCGLLAIGLGMSFIPSEGDQLIREADKAVLALASSAGGALIGVLAPKPGSG